MVSHLMLCFFSAINLRATVVINMKISRIKRVDELLRREIGSVLFRVINDDGFDLSSISVTRVMTSPTLRRARVFVSIRDNYDRRDDMLAILNKHRIEIQKHISRNIVLKYTPRLTFEIDCSLEKGDHILDILSKMEETTNSDQGSSDKTQECEDDDTFGL